MRDRHTYTPTNIDTCTYTHTADRFGSHASNFARNCMKKYNQYKQIIINTNNITNNNSQIDLQGQVINDLEDIFVTLNIRRKIFIISQMRNCCNPAISYEKPLSGHRGLAYLAPSAQYFINAPPAHNFRFQKQHTYTNTQCFQ